jgi:hypothetical protein
MPQQSLPDLLESLTQATNDLTEYEDDIPVDSVTLSKLQTAVTAIKEIAREAADFAADRCEDCGENPCVCEDDEEDEDEG